jgi:hypothetical protein
MFGGRGGLKLNLLNAVKDLSESSVGQVGRPILLGRLTRVLCAKIMP